MGLINAALDHASELEKALGEKDSRLQTDSSFGKKGKELRTILEGKKAQLLLVDARHRETEAKVSELLRRFKGSKEAAQENLLRSQDKRRRISSPKEGDLQIDEDLAEQLMEELMEKVEVLYQAEARQRETDEEIGELQQHLSGIVKAAKETTRWAMGQQISLNSRLITARDRGDMLQSRIDEKDSEWSRVLAEEKERLLQAEARQRDTDAEVERLRQRLRDNDVAVLDSLRRAEEQQNNLTAQFIAARDRSDELRRVVNGNKAALAEQDEYLLQAEAQRRAMEIDILEMRQKTLQAEELQKSFVMQLIAARDEADELRKIVKEKDAQLRSECGLAELRREISLKDDQLLQAEAWRRVVEAENAELRLRLRRGDDAEIARLRRELQEARAGQAMREPSQKEVVQRVAALECQPLKSAGQDARAAMKKKLLLKWHPDKQIGTDAAAFSTEVMQEIQNRCEWA